MRILLATTNPAKKQRYTRVLSAIAEEVVGLSDAGIYEMPVESGESAEENAELKARFYAAKGGIVAFAEDEALYVDFLPEEAQPGVNVRRVNGSEEVDDSRLLEYWQNVVSATAEHKRTGKWHIAYCLATPRGSVALVSQEHPIRFFSPPSQVRIPGWPMSSVQGPAALARPRSELSGEELRAIDDAVDGLLLDELRQALTVLL